MQVRPICHLRSAVCCAYALLFWKLSLQQTFLAKIFGCAWAGHASGHLSTSFTTSTALLQRRQAGEDLFCRITECALVSSLSRKRGKTCGESKGSPECLSLGVPRSKKRTNASSRQHSCASVAPTCQKCLLSRAVGSGPLLAAQGRWSISCKELCVRLCTSADIMQTLEHSF